MVEDKAPGSPGLSPPPAVSKVLRGCSYDSTTCTFTSTLTWTKESSSYESEEDLTPPATPPLLNGHVVRHQEGLLNGGHDLTLTQVRQELEQARALVTDLNNQHDEGYNQADLHPQENLTNGGLTHQPKQLSVPSKEERPTTPHTDDELAGVNLRELRSSYLTAAHVAKQVDHSEEIEKSRISIKELVGTYSSPPPSTPPPNKTCPDDLTPVSFRSLKSAYEATAATPSGAGSRNSSCSSSFGLGGSPHLDQDLSGISFKHLREEYCRTASQETHSRSSSPCKPPPDTGVSIRQLCASFLSTSNNIMDPSKENESSKDNDIDTGVSVISM